MTKYGTTELYRLSEGPMLLYIGISSDYWKHRRPDHARRYGPSVADSPVIETYASRQLAELAEVNAQFNERPRDGAYPTTKAELAHALATIQKRYIHIDEDPVPSSFVLAVLLSGIDSRGLPAYEVARRNWISERTKAGLEARKASGHRLGRPVKLPDEVRNRIRDLNRRGLSLRAIASVLDADGVPTARGGVWRSSTIRAVLHSLAIDEGNAA